MNLDRVFKQYSINGVVSLKNIKRKDLKLYRTIKSKDFINTSNYLILYDEKSITRVNIYAYLMYHFGIEVDITKLRSKHPHIYSHLNRLGRAVSIIRRMGFEVEYSSRVNERKIYNILKGISHDRVIYNITRRVYGRLYYYAKKKGMTVKELIEYYGFKYYFTKISKDDIIKLRKEGSSFSEIAKILGISKTQAYRLYKKEV